MWPRWQRRGGARRLYTPGPYYVAKLAATLPFNVLISVAHVLVGYGMFGYRHRARSVAQVRGALISGGAAAPAALLV